MEKTLWQVLTRYYSCCDPDRTLDFQRKIHKYPVLRKIMENGRLPRQYLWPVFIINNEKPQRAIIYMVFLHTGNCTWSSVLCKLFYILVQASPSKFFFFFFIKFPLVFQMHWKRCLTKVAICIVIICNCNFYLSAWAIFPNVCPLWCKWSQENLRGLPSGPQRTRNISNDPCWSTRCIG